jgi:tripartite-type tricarboxylate transporter receptor subunit TctC
MLKQLAAVIATIAVLAGLPPIAGAQTYPSKTITIIVPYAGGGSLDNLIRLATAYLQKVLEQPLIIENRRGAGGLLGSSYVAKQAAPDGYTLLFTVASIATYPALNKNLSFDPLKDLTPVSIYYRQPYIYMTSKDSAGGKSVRDFVAYAKANPGKLNYGSSGRSLTMLATEMFLSEAGIDVQAVPFSKLSDIAVALLRNDIQLYTPGLTSVADHVKSGAIVPLFVTGSIRMAVLPDTPTSAEVGYPNFTPTAWGGFFAPAGTPASVVETFAAALKKVVGDPAVKEALEQREGVEPVASSPQEARALMARETQAFIDVVRKIGLQPE